MVLRQLMGKGRVQKLMQRHGIKARGKRKFVAHPYAAGQQFLPHHGPVVFLLDLGVKGLDA